MRRAKVVSLSLVVTPLFCLIVAPTVDCGGSSTSDDATVVPEGGGLPDRGALGDGDGGGADGTTVCTANADCTTNPGAPCRKGVVACTSGQTTCVDSVPAKDGTSCTGGVCTSGTCYAPQTIGADVDLSTTAVTAGRTCAEGVAHAVASLAATSATLASAPAAGCLAPGDEVLLIDLQGAPSATENVGNWEVLDVAAVAGAQVTFVAAKTKSYGATAGSDTGIGAGPTDQKVALVRVPRFGELTVSAGVTLKGARWDGATGGVLALHAAKLVVDGTITMAGAGYRGGRWSRDNEDCSDSVATETGESIDGPGAAALTANVGGAGGIGAGTGIVFVSNTPLNSGASHATVGGTGSNGNGRTVGAAGTVYGANDASKLTLGSGQSGNITCDIGFAGPQLVVIDERLAGGIVLLIADRLDVGASGTITASGVASARDVSASGGYVFVRGTTLNVGAERVLAVGGTGTGANGPTAGMTVNAGDGYVVLAGTVTGTTKPAAHTL